MDMMNNSLLSLYRQVEDRLRGEIASGNFKEGDLIPSEQELAQRYGVNQGTVRKAVLNLTQNGLLYRKQGKGTFVVFQKQNRGRYRNFLSKIMAISPINYSTNSTTPPKF